MKHIGIVAHSSEGAALCYREVCLEGMRLLGPHQHPEVTMSSIPMGRSMEHWESGDLDAIAAILLDGVRAVAAAGADFFVCPDNTAHLAFDRVEPSAPIPALRITDAVAQRAEDQGYRRVGIMGTRYMMAGGLYPPVMAARDIESVLPEREDWATINRIIFDELVQGLVVEDSRRYLVSKVEELGGRGCHAVVLGCTELPLIVRPEDSPLPLLDSTRLLVRAAVREALG